MSPTTSTSEQTQFTGDVSGPQTCEGNSEQIQHAAAGENIQHPTQASEEAYILDKDKRHSSSPLMAGSSTDMALVPPSLSPLAEDVTNESVCKLTTLGMASSDATPIATPNIGCAEPALPLPEPVVERLTVPRDLLLPPPGDSQNCQVKVKPLDVVPMHLGGLSSGDPQTTLLDCFPSCLAPDSALSAPDNIPNDAELFVTRPVTYADHRLPSGPTSTVSSPDTSEKTDPPSIDSDVHLTPCEGLVYQNVRSQSYEAGIPSLSPTPGALLTPLLSVDDLASSSPLHPEPSSDVFMHSTPPLSSPQIESNLTIFGDLATRDRYAGPTSGDARIDDYPAVTMSSPNFPLHEDDFSVSSSPPYPTTGTKRARYDDSDEESSKPMKRVRTDDTMSSPLRNPPAPRRATLASQKLSRKRLAAPFRSPLQTKAPTMQPTTPALLRKDIQVQIARESRAKYQIKPKSAQEEAPAGTPKAIKPSVRSSRAAAQFRSPLVKVPEHTARPLVLPNQTIMNLERKLTILRRAAKIKRDGDEAHLERLAKKWRDAGREAAYELWGIVRDLSTEGGEIRGNRNNNGWGWGEQGERGTFQEDDANMEPGEDAEKQENTLGVMLRKLAIAPETLGWNDEEEAFVDDDCE